MNKRRRYKAKARRRIAKLWHQGTVVAEEWVIRDIFETLSNRIESVDFNRSYDPDWRKQLARV